MKLHNTLTRTVEDFQPHEGQTVTLYTCGPTVYDYGHIGNLRNAVFNDTLRRALEVCGYKVKHVMNITDVGHLVSDADDGEDKLEKGAKREGKTVWEVAEHYTAAYKADMQSLNVLPPNGYKSDKHQDNYARATEFIDQQIAMVQALLDKGFAYQTEQAIYFDVAKLPDYGKLTGQKLDDKEVGVRDEVVTDSHKRSPHDFAVWFFAVGHFKDHAMQWPSPWGDGFPGWHLECSAIIHATLGDPIDIHTGGIDLIGTHHTNEIAQTEAAFGHPLAHTWVHNEFVLVDGAKMAKSKGNFFTLKDITDKDFDSLAFRMLALQSHYRSELHFSWDNLQAAQNRLKGLQELADLKHQAVDDVSAFDEDFFVKYQDVMTAAIADDLKTPEVLRELSELQDKVVNNGGLNNSDVDSFNAFLEFMDQMLGLNLSQRPDLDGNQKHIFSERQTARREQDWATADKLRDQLKEQGIGVRDTARGQTWYRL